MPQAHRVHVVQKVPLVSRAHKAKPVPQAHRVHVVQKAL